MSYFHFVYLSLDSRFLTCWARNYICCTFLLSSSPLLLPSSILPSHVSSPPPLGSTSALWPCGRYCPDWSVSFLVGSRQGLDWALGGEVCCPRACPSRELSCLSCVAFGHSRMIGSAPVHIVSGITWHLAGTCLSFFICIVDGRILSGTGGIVNSGDEPSVSECGTAIGPELPACGG